jgi:predicted dehydrogenase
MSERSINVGIIGCGRIAREHAAGYRRLGDRFRIAALVDRQPACAQALAAECGGRAYSTFEEACAAESLEAVDLCLPPSAHCPAALAAIERGLHVLVEKPLALSCDEADRMIAAAQRRRVVLMSGQSRRFNGPLRKAKQLMDEGAIGKPLFGCVWYGMKVEAQVPWWADPAVSGPSNMLANWGSHSLDEICYLYGPPCRAFAEGRDTGGPTAGVDLVSVVFGYDSGLVANMNWSYVGRQPAGVPGAVGGCLPAIGIAGCIGSRGVLQYGQDVGPTGVLLDGQPVPNDDREVNQFHTMLAEFHGAIVEGREPETSAARCRVVIELIEAILESCRSHQPVAIRARGEDGQRISQAFALGYCRALVQSCCGSGGQACQDHPRPPAR